VARAGISNGPNTRPLDETIAETGPGLPDDAAAEGERPPGEAAKEADAQAAALKRKGWAEKPRH
jgi:hypothetical protein